MLRAYGGATSGGKVRFSGRGAGNGNSGGVPQTQQFWNAATKGSGVVLSNGNLTANIGPTVSQGVFSTGSKNSGLYYAEVLVGTQTPGITAVHIGIAAPARLGSTASTPDGTNAITLRSDGISYGGAGSVNGTSYVANDVIGILFDYTNKKAIWYKNGVNTNGYSLFTALQAGRIFAWQNNNNGETHLLTIRTTTAEFSYPVPGGYLPWGAA